MATYPKILKERLDYLRADYTESRQRYIDALPQFHAAQRVVDQCNIELTDEDGISDLRVKGWLDGRSVVIRCDVVAFRDVAFILDMVEAQGYEFTESSDYPAGSERTFRAYPNSAVKLNRNCWSVAGLTVEAHLINEGVEGCKRVVLRYETPPPQPVYGFDCGDPNERPHTEANEARALQQANNVIARHISGVGDDDVPQ